MQTEVSEFDIRSTAERTIIDLSARGFLHACRIGRYSYSGVRRQLDQHIHPGTLEICYCDKGQQIYEVGKRKYRIKGGDVFVTFPDEVHSTGNCPEDKGTLYWLLIRIPENRKTFLHYRGEYASALAGKLLGLPSRHFRGSEEMKKMLEDMLLLLQQPNDTFNRLTVYNILTSFLLAVIRCTHTGVPAPERAPRIEEIKRYIEENLHGDLSIELLAEREHLSESHFKSWFKREAGITPMDYVLRRKMERAKQWLVREPSLNITQVAFRLNFSSSQYFATVFKKYTGLTPSAFRNLPPTV